MKNIIILSILILFTTITFAQQTTPTPTPNTNWKDSDLYKKSKTQKTVGWIMTGAGMAGLTITLGLDINQMTENTLGGILGENTEEKSYAVPYVISSAVLVGGIYLLFRATHNKKKAQAASAFIDMEKAPLLQGSVFRYQSFPVVGLRVRL
jgi:hypothetical protein